MLLFFVRYRGYTAIRLVLFLDLDHAFHLNVLSCSLLEISSFSLLTNYIGVFAGHCSWKHASLKLVTFLLFFGVIIVCLHLITGLCCGIDLDVVMVFKVALTTIDNLCVFDFVQ